MAVRGRLTATGSSICKSHAGKTSLMMVKTSGNAAPVVLREGVNKGSLPDWSPAGDWITFNDDKGWNLISPDGKTSKSLGKIGTRYLAFSKSGKLLYGMQWRPDFRGYRFPTQS